MSPDDERSEEKGEGAPRTSDADAHARQPADGAAPREDDLAALAGELPTSAHESVAPEDEHAPAFDALARVGGRRAGNEEGDSRLDLGQLVAAASQSSTPSARPAAGEPITRALAPATSSTAPARASWMLPLLVGMVLGAGIASAGYSLGRSAHDEHDAAKSAAPAPPTAAAPAAAELHAPEPTPAKQPEALAQPQAAPSVAVLADNTVAGNPISNRKGVAKVGHGESALSPESTARAQAPMPTGDGVVTAVLPGEEPPANPPAAPASAAAPSAAAPSAAAPSAAAPSAKGAGSSVDQLLDDALSPSARKNELDQAYALELEHQKLPPTPSRDDVTQAMTVLLPAIRGCALGQSGTAVAGMVVRADGRVASVEISGAPFAGTASGRCMEGVMRRARFPRFTQPVFRVRFPLAIQ